MSYSEEIKDIRKQINIIEGVITVKHMKGTSKYSPCNYNTWKKVLGGKIRTELSNKCRNMCLLWKINHFKRFCWCSY